jgi:DNA repair exonuclease SbcCD ATPase subunit
VSPTPTFHQPEPQRSSIMPALVTGAIIALVAANIYLYVQIDHVRTDVAKVQDKLSNELTTLRDASNVTSEAQKRHLETLREELDAARAQARSAASQGKAEAQAYADQKVRALEAEQAKVQQEVSSEISNVKSNVQQVATAADAKIATVSTDVGAVKSQATQTEAELQKTITELKSVKGDLGVQSGLVATNASELSALKLRGERNYFEFKLPKAKKPQRVGDISLTLKAADPKKNKFTLEVLADDKTTEKKDKGINEPLQFYTIKGGHIPYELVINKVDNNNQITGYLATPKVEATR